VAIGGGFVDGGEYQRELCVSPDAPSCSLVPFYHANSVIESVTLSSFLSCAAQNGK